MDDTVPLSKKHCAAIEKCLRADMDFYGIKGEEYEVIKATRKPDMYIGMCDWYMTFRNTRTGAELAAHGIAHPSGKPAQYYGFIR